MLRKKMTFLRSVTILLALLSFTLLAGLAQGQTDPGPRPVGTNSPFCPIQSAKFPTAPACIDTVQPADSLGDGGAGNVVSGTSNLTGFWFQALAVFEVKGVVGPVAQTGGSTFPGLGPSFNGLSCFQCHSQPTVGGSSPGLTKGVQTPGFPNGNPQTQLTSKAGANGIAPDQAQLTAVTTAPAGFQPILTIDSAGNGTGPVREVRFPDGFAGNSTSTPPIDPVPNGSVAELFVVDGRTDNPPGCQIGQEPFQTEISDKNVIFRIPIPTFGEGFVENTTDDTLQANLKLENNIANNFFNPSLGITGTFNTSGNDQTITKFGWKAQNKSMLIFAGEASNVEMGITNENFTNERTDGNGKCSPNFEPEDQVVVPPLNVSSNASLNDPRTIPTIFNNANFGAPGVASDISSLIENFAVFMRLNASPSQCNYNSAAGQCLALDASAQRGAKIFGSLDSTVAGSFTSAVADNNPNTTTVSSIGCVLCHSNALTTTTSDTPELSNASFRPFSDFAIHTMDSSLSDRVTQGAAGPTQFRSAPLWGLGQRLFFMHDGRADDLLEAIKAHAPNAGTVSTNCTAAMGEACQVIVLFNNLSVTSKQDLLNFLRSL